MSSGHADHAQVIALSSDDTDQLSSSELESVHIYTPTRETNAASVTTPAHLSARPSRSLAARRVSGFPALTPDTPDTLNLPSPSMLLMPSAVPNKTHTPPPPTFQHETPTRGPLVQAAADIGLGLLSREEALELPSSPPVCILEDDSASVAEWRISSPSLGESPQASPRELPGMSPLFANMATSTLGRPLATARHGSPGAQDVLTDSLDSSDDESPRWRRPLAGAKHISSPKASSTAADPPQPAASVAPKGPFSRLLHSDGAGMSQPLSSRSSSLGSFWKIQDAPRTPMFLRTQSMTAATPDRQSGGGSEAARREEAARRRAAKAAEKQQREEQRQFQRSLSAVNHARTDPKDLLPDTTLLVASGLLAALGMSKQADNSATPLALEPLQDAGVAWRAENLAMPAAVQWELRKHRRWDALLGHYVPLPQPRVVRVRQAAMVVMDSAYFLGLVAGGRMAQRLEVWRASLAVSRLLVTVIGLQKHLRRAATAESREFARQMRQYLKGNGAQPATPARPRRQGAGETAPASMSSTGTDTDVSEETVEETILHLHMTCPWVSWFVHCADARALGKLLLQTTMDVAHSEYTRKGDGVLGWDDERSVGDLEQVDSARSGAAARPGFQTGWISSDVASALNATAAVRSGTDMADTWVQALTQIPKVSQPVARSIAAAYPTPRSLLRAWSSLRTGAEREQMLAQLTVGGGRRLGAVMSFRIYRFFHEIDPNRPYAEL
ncbi:hypothetical protein GGI07_000366 [Coemansia sp. Benny D115]|nr:hypothetical protein GGI07_000366 [Coemansia sp. Benny D115]